MITVFFFIQLGWKVIAMGRNDFLPPHPTWVKFLQVPHEQNMHFSIEICSSPMDRLL